MDGLDENVHPLNTKTSLLFLLLKFLSANFAKDLKFSSVKSESILIFSKKLIVSYTPFNTLIFFDVLFSQVLSITNDITKK